MFHISMAFSPRLKVFFFCILWSLSDNDEQTVVLVEDNGNGRFGIHMHKETLHFRRKEHILIYNSKLHTSY